MIKRIISIATLLCLILFLNETTGAAIFQSRTITEPEKDWTITFNDGVDYNPETDQSICIESDTSEKHPVSYSLSADFKKITVKPLKPYIIGKSYLLVIPKEVGSVKGKKLKSDVTMEFKLQGTFILNIHAKLNPLVTNVKVQSVKDVAKMTVSVNGTAENLLHLSNNNTFSRGMPGLTSGDELLVRAYDRKGNLLEDMAYKVSE